MYQTLLKICIYRKIYIRFTNKTPIRKKQKERDELFNENLFPIMDNIDNPALVEQWKQNLDSYAYEKIYTKM